MGMQWAVCGQHAPHARLTITVYSQHLLCLIHTPPTPPPLPAHPSKEEPKKRRALLAVVYRLLADSASGGAGRHGGGTLAGALLWNGAHNDTADQDG